MRHAHGTGAGCAWRMRRGTVIHTTFLTKLDDAGVSNNATACRLKTASWNKRLPSRGGWLKRKKHDVAALHKTIPTCNARWKSRAKKSASEKKARHLLIWTRTRRRPRCSPNTPRLFHSSQLASIPSFRPKCSNRKCCSSSTCNSKNTSANLLCSRLPSNTNT